MLEDVNSRVRNLWNSTDERAQITFVDDGFSELLKWRGSDSNNGNCIAAVLSLNMDASDLLLVSSYKAKRLLFCVSYVSSDVFRKVKNMIKVSGATEAIILLSISPDAFRTVVDSSKVQLQFLQGSDGDASTDRSYDWLHRFLKPECVGIVYYPVHSFSILSSVRTNVEQRNNAGDDAQCELINITSPTCRDVNPLTLHSIGMWNINDSIQNISDLPAGDIPLRDSAKLKGFAHELAGTLLFDLGLDPSASIFALGSTSSLIGRHLQPVLSSLSKTRSSLIKTERVQSSCEGTEILLSGSIISTSSSSSSSASSSSTLISPKMTTDNIFQPKPAAASSGGSLFPLPLPLPSRSLPGQSTAVTGPERMGDITSKYTAQCSLDSLQAASLLLIDRTQDLYTPSTHSGEASKELHTSPLAHRILCTLSKGLGSADSTLYDVSTMAPFNVPSSSTSTYTTSTSSSRSSNIGVVHGGAVDMDALGRPFPAISTLPLQLPMSLCLSLNNLQERNLSGVHGRGLSESGTEAGAEAGAVHADSDLLLLRQALFARSEEEGRTLLCAALTRRIKQFKGTVPPSKKGRGLGAEVFALVQALSTCPGVTGDTLGNWLDRKEKESRGISSLQGPGSEELKVPIVKDSNSIGFSPCTCLSTQALLSVSMLVVEAMQRSSKKQFKLHAGPCASWITSCEARAATDVEVQRLISEGKNLGDLISHLKNVLDADMNTSSSSSSVPSSSSSSSAPSPSPRITRSKVSSASATATSTSSAAASGISGQRSSSPSGADSDPADAVCVLLQLVRVISYFGLRNDKNKEGNDRFKDRDESTSGDSNSGNLFSSSDFSHLRKPESVSRTVKITDFADEKSFALSALKGFLGVLEGYLMMRSPPGELHYLSRLGLISKYLVDDILSHRAQSSRSNSQPSLHVEVEVEEEMSEEAARLRLEMSDCISHLGGLFTELGSLSSLPPPLPPSAFPSPSRHLNNAVAVTGNSVEGAGGQESLGVIARSVLSFLRHRLHQLSNQNSQNSGRGIGNGSGTGAGSGVALGGFLTANLRPSPQSGTGIGIGAGGNAGQSVSVSAGPECDDVISACEFIEPPLKVIKRVGMDILSTGWGRLGFQSGAGNTANGTAKDRDNTYEAVLVVCVVGGVSYIEVAQVQSVLSSFLRSYPDLRTSGGAPRVVIVSTSALEPESLLKYLRPAESTR